MGSCSSNEFYDIELTDLKPLELIKPFKIKNKIVNNEYDIKYNIYWIYYNENYFINHILKK